MKRTNWTKKATLLLVAVCLALAALHTAFAKPEEQWLLQVEGIPVSRELYAYFLSEALQEGDYFAGGTDGGQPKALEALRRDAAARCAAFIAVNSELRGMGLTLEQQYKVQIAERTGYLWRTFGAYYEANGIDKETVGSVQAAKAARKQIFFALYGEGGARAVPEESIQSYFYGNYVAYNGIRVFRTRIDENGAETALSAEETGDLRKTLSALAGEVNAGADFFAAAQNYGEALSYSSPSAALVRKGSAGYPADAFEKIRQLDFAKVTLLEFPEFFLLASGLNMRLSQAEYYQVYRESCLWEMKQPEFEESLKGLFAAYRADENTAAVERLLEGWNWAAEQPRVSASTTAAASSTAKEENSEA